ncbi:hypothetical protein PAXRUDRAFT_170200, partial [Paxillus rubicundulus Ve08.2h10]
PHLLVFGATAQFSPQPLVLATTHLFWMPPAHFGCHPLIIDHTHLYLTPPTHFEPCLLIFGPFLTPPTWFSAPPTCPGPHLFAFDPACLF